MLKPATTYKKTKRPFSSSSSSLGALSLVGRRERGERRENFVQAKAKLTGQQAASASASAAASAAAAATRSTPSRGCCSLWSDSNSGSGVTTTKCNAVVPGSDASPLSTANIPKATQLELDVLGATGDSAKIRIETGEIGRQAAGAVTVTSGETVIYCTACAEDDPDVANNAICF